MGYTPSYLLDGDGVSFLSPFELVSCLSFILSCADFLAIFLRADIFLSTLLVKKILALTGHFWSFLVMSPAKKITSFMGLFSRKTETVLGGTILIARKYV